MRILLFISLCVLSVSEAGAQSRDQIKESIEVTLSARHPDDKKETWLSMGAETPEVILEMLESGESGYRRVRLIESLGYFQSEKVSEFFRKEAKSSKNSQYKMSSIKGLLLSEGERAVEFAKEFLEDSDAEVRVSVARSLKYLGTVRAQQVVNDYLATEELAWVKRKIQSERSKLPVQASLKVTGSNAGKPELFVLGKWEGYTFVWNKKKKELTPKKVSVDFDLGLKDKIILKWKVEGDRKYSEAKLEKEKWKWGYLEIPDQEKLLELSSEVLKLKMWAVKQD